MLVGFINNRGIAGDRSARHEFASRHELGVLPSERPAQRQAGLPSFWLGRPRRRACASRGKERVVLMIPASLGGGYFNLVFPKLHPGPGRRMSWPSRTKATQLITARASLIVQVFLITLGSTVRLWTRLLLFASVGRKGCSSHNEGLSIFLGGARGCRSSIQRSRRRGGPTIVARLAYV